MGEIKRRRKTKETPTARRAQMSLTPLGNRRQMKDPTRGMDILRIR